MLFKQSGVNSTDLIRIYLNEIGCIPLLTRTEEISYGQSIQQMMSVIAAKETLAQQLHTSPTFQEWAAYIQISEFELNRILRSGSLAKRKMVESNLRLVVAIAKQCQNRNVELLDLIQEGTLGLLKATEKFDPTLEYKFSTYAYWWIRQAITRAISQQGRTIRLPIHLTDKLNKIKKIQRQLEQNLGRTPTITEISSEMKLTSKQVRSCLEQGREIISLDLVVGKERNTKLGDVLEANHSDITAFDWIVRSSIQEEVNQLLGDLTPQQQKVISLRFGLESGSPLSLEQIGQRLNLSRERVRQIEHKALESIKREKADLAMWL